MSESDADDAANKFDRLFKKWSKDFNWLGRSDNPQGGALLCTLCIQGNKRNKFTKGCTRLKRSAIQEHAISNDHKAAIDHFHSGAGGSALPSNSTNFSTAISPTTPFHNEIQNNLTPSMPEDRYMQTPISKRSFDQAFVSSISSVRNIPSSLHSLQLSPGLVSPETRKVETPKKVIHWVEYALRSVYHLVKNDHSLLEFNNIGEFISFHFNLFNNSRIDITEEQMNNSKRYLRILSQVIEEEIITKLRNSGTFSILLDQPSDFENYFFLYVKYVINGSAETRFLDIIEVTSLDENTISEAILFYLREKNIEIENLVGLASNGSHFVMKESGVAQILKRQSPFMLSVHSVIHGLSLIAQDAAEAAPQVKQFESDMKALFSYLARFPMRMSELKLSQTQGVESETDVLEISSPYWLLSSNAIENVARSLSSVVNFLEENAKGDRQASHLLDIISGLPFQYTLFFLVDILSCIKVLNKVFLSKSVSSTEIRQQVQSTIYMIRSIYLGNSVGGVFLPEFLGSIEGGGSEELVLMEEMAKLYASALVKSLEDRFPDTEIWSAFSILDPRAYPANINNLENFGNNECTILLQYFGKDRLDANGQSHRNVVDPFEFKREFLIFRTHIACSYSNTTFDAMCKNVLTENSFRLRYPETVKLMEILLTLPTSMMECEVGFVYHNRIKKSKQRLALRGGKIDVKLIAMQMLVYLEGPTIEHFDFAKAQSLWSQEPADITHEFTNC